MKHHGSHLLRVRLLIAGLGWLMAGTVTAQTLTNLYTFTAVVHATNGDGANPVGGLILAGNTLYGTAVRGGGSGRGAVFAVNSDGTGFTNLHTFTPTFGPLSANADGANPYAGLVLAGNTLYGTASAGGSSGKGTVFALNTDGTGFTNLHTFTATSGSLSANSDGANPYAGLMLTGGTLFGTANSGGSSGAGAVFAVNTDGTGFTNLHNFTATSGALAANNDGANPFFAGLILKGDVLYGVANNGGPAGNGTVFAVKTNGADFANVHSFTATPGPFYTNSDGANPSAGLILSGDTLYGTTVNGGSGYGTVFAVNTDGSGFTNRHSFTRGIDGANPQAPLILSGNILYGVTSAGASSDEGTVFAIGRDGTGFTNLYDFAPEVYDSFIGAYTNRDGAAPVAGLVLSGGTLYGAAEYGASSGAGAVFSLSLPNVYAPRLTITPSGSNIVLTWPTNEPQFTLQSVANLISPVNWNTASPAPVIVNGLNTVTNTIAGPGQFYRLVR